MTHNIEKFRGRTGFRAGWGQVLKWCPQEAHASHHSALSCVQVILRQASPYLAREFSSDYFRTPFQQFPQKSQGCHWATMTHVIILEPTVARGWDHVGGAALDHLAAPKTEWTRVTSTGR